MTKEAKLIEEYNKYCNTPSDINEHLPTLKKYAEECNHITEMGVRRVVSTFAFLMAKPNILISIDYKHPSFWGGGDSLLLAEQISTSQNTNFTFIEGDTRALTIEPTDLLFIDTWHVYEQLKIELMLHSSKVNKYIILHDTTSFEFIGESDQFYDGNSHKGLWPAIEEFLDSNNNWKIKERFTNNNGLTILAKINNE